MFHLAFGAILISYFLATLPVKAASGVDVVLVSNQLRVMNVSDTMVRLRPNETEFAVQNTSDVALVFDLHITGRDIFHQAVLGYRENAPVTPYRLVSSDDQETTSVRQFPNRLPISLMPGEVKRFLLIGETPTRAKFWIWDRNYHKKFEQNQTVFRQILLSSLAVFGFLCVPAAYRLKRWRLLLPAFFSLSIGGILYLRWEATHFTYGLVFLRLLLLVGLAYVVFAHRALLRLPWTERRYWRTVVLSIDILLFLCVLGWVTLYFQSDFLDSISTEWLEFALAMTAILLCLASNLYFLFPGRSKLTPDRN
ncbi:MAG: hypothetical protein ACON41_05915 [Parvibaculales bacterium]